MEQEVIDLGIKHTKFIFVSTEDYVVKIFEDCIQEIAFASFGICEQKLTFVIEEFNDWSLIRELLYFGKMVSQNLKHIKRVTVETHDDMREQVLYMFRTYRVVWYAHHGYIPYYRDWDQVKITNFFQLPFTKPEDFLDLEYGEQLIFPPRIIIHRYDQPVFLQTQKEPSAFRYRLLPPTSFFKKSKRPINSMTILRQSQYGIMDISKVPDYVKKSGAPFKIDDNYFIPVVRYSLGMNQGCYFETNENTKYLGTFYYWEPDSNIYLNMGKKFGYFTTKMECALHLQTLLLDETRISEIPIALYQELENCILSIRKEIVREFYKHYEEESHLFETRLTMDDYYEEDEIEDVLISDFNLIYRNMQPRHVPIDLTYKSTITGEYMRKLFYASEDELDQVVAKGLLYFGYDVVIFGKMAGNFRVVSEVLDVRERQTSLSSLYWSVI